MKPVSRLAGFFALLAAIIHQPTIACGQGSAFTYQGQLMNNGAPASGTYALQFTLYATNATGVPIAGPVTNTPVVVTNGLFTTIINFGNVFTGTNYWLDIAVSTNGTTFTELTPRQQLTPVPYAIFAESSSNLSGTVPAAQVSGTLPAADLPASVVTNNASGLTLNGTFTGNGAGVTNINAATLNGLSATNFWQLAGNNVAGGQFLGSTNFQAVQVLVNGARALSLAPTTNDVNHSNMVNIAGGAPANFIQPGTYGAVIAGGGAANYNGNFNYSNTVGSDLSFLGGGGENLIQSSSAYSVLSGGFDNVIQTNSTYSTIAGGYKNLLEPNAVYSGIGGGYENSIQTNASYSYVGGGQINMIQPGAYNSFIGGGYENTLNSIYSVIGGGFQNTISEEGSVIVGGDGNAIQGSGSMGNEVIVGGAGNFLTNSPSAVVVGGENNVMYSGNDYAFLGGGSGNILKGGFNAFLGGGNNNSMDGSSAFLGGGSDNVILLAAYNSFLGGGQSNTNGGPYSVVAGGYENYAGGEYSFAAGQQAQALTQGSFVWADSEAGPFTSISNNQFLVRAAGGVGINENNPPTALGVNGTVTATLFSGSGAGLTSLPATNLVGTFPLASLPANVVTNFESGVTLSNLNVNGGLMLPLPAGIYSALGSDTNHIIFADANLNFFAGVLAGFSTTSGSQNTGVGSGALENNTGGNDNTANGFVALNDNTTGSNNVAIGIFALANSTTDNGLVAIGYQALRNDNALNVTSPGPGTVSGNGENTAIGYQSLQADTFGYANTAVGNASLLTTTTGYLNTALGDNALKNNTAGYQNTAVGNNALGSEQTGNNNIALGYNAGVGFGSGSNNIYIGNSGNSSESSITRIGTSQTDAYLAGTVHANGGVNVDDNSQNTGTLTADALTFGSGSSGEGIASKRSGGNSDDLEFYTGFNQWLTILHNGNVGIGTNNPSQALEVNGEFLQVDGLGGVRCYMGNDGIADDVQVGSQTTGVTDVTLFNTANNAYMHLNCSSITIEGGSDLAEPFQISARDNGVPEGAVVVIDDQNPGHLKLSDSPYDVRVAGVVSGANGVHPGIQMHQQGLLEGGKNVALTGRVYVQADASNGAIRPGDMLTTSSTPGYAMKVTDHARAEGAILGKAMTRLNEGNGMVLVLVTLQ